MGGILTSGTNLDYGLSCNTAEDCYGYKNSAGAIATTDAEKLLRCCFHTKVNTIANYPLGKLNAETYGWP